MKKWLPYIVTGVMAAWFLSMLSPPADKDFAFGEFGKLPLVFNGRVKPMDSLARSSLLQIREKQTLNTEPWKAWNEKPKIISATEWMANVMMNPAGNRFIVCLAEDGRQCFGPFVKLEGGEI